MQTVDHRTYDHEHDVKLIDWRKQNLVRHGLTMTEAETLAEYRDVNLEQCRKMLDQGCTPELLMRIIL